MGVFSSKTTNAAPTAATTAAPTTSTSKKSKMDQEQKAKRFLEHTQWLGEQQSEQKEGEEGIIDTEAIDSARKRVDIYENDTKNPVKYMDAVCGHIKLASAGITQFEGVTKKVCYIYLLFCY